MSSRNVTTSDTSDIAAQLLLDSIACGVAEDSAIQTNPLTAHLLFRFGDSTGCGFPDTLHSKTCYHLVSTLLQYLTVDIILCRGTTAIHTRTTEGRPRSLIITSRLLFFIWFDSYLSGYFIIISNFSNYKKQLFPSPSQIMAWRLSADYWLDKGPNVARTMMVVSWCIGLTVTILHNVYPKWSKPCTDQIKKYWSLIGW